MERQGIPFIVYRDDQDAQVIQVLDTSGHRVTVGRGDGCDVRLGWDTKVSRLHAELVCAGDEWTVTDNGLSRNGTTVGGEPVRGQRRLRDGDLIEFGHTVVAFRDPRHTDVGATAPLTGRVTPKLSDGDLDVLRALGRPLLSDPFAAPAPNAEIAGELHLSIAAVKSRLHSLFERFDIDDLPQNQKRATLAAHALRSGLVDS